MLHYGGAVQSNVLYVVPIALLRLAARGMSIRSLVLREVARHFACHARGSSFIFKQCFVRASLDLEHIAVLSASAADLAGLPWAAAAVTGCAVYLLIE